MNKYLTGFKNLFGYKSDWLSLIGFFILKLKEKFSNLIKKPLRTLAPQNLSSLKKTFVPLPLRTFVPP